ncbi:MAG: SDR family oxidoreductase [Candidatus Pacebacteria bacterium]|nr:SDR family oxidoreductase [Candidatus Paceibacterota bacterium]
MHALIGKRVLVTGGAVRIGRAIALRFAEAGARVIVHYRSSVEQAQELKSQLDTLSSGNAIVQADLTDAARLESLIADASALGGGLDILVNNASVYRRTPLLKLDAHRLRKDMEINFFAPLLLMRDFARQCQRGVIINLLDQRVTKVEPSAGSYGLAKKGLRDATEAAALEWAPDIRVNGVAPGFVLPPPGVSADKMKGLLGEVPLHRETSPEEIAEACAFLAAAETVTGQVLFVDGGMHLTGAAQLERDEADYG